MCLRNVSPCEVIDAYLILSQSDKLTQWMANIGNIGLPKRDKHIWTFTFHVSS